MGGVDLVLFTGGIGENDAAMREAACQGLEFMGIEMDTAKNAGIHGQDALVSTPASKVKVVVVTTDEEKVIATDTLHIISK